MPRNDIYRISDAKITYRNFSGKATPYRPAGQRTFAVIIPNEEIAQDMTEKGWNVRMRPPHDEGDIPEWYIEVKVSFDIVPPKIYMVTKNRKQLLTEDLVGELDSVDIDYCDIELNPYHWGPINGKSGIKAYLKTMYVNVIEDSFADKYKFIGE